MSIKRVMGALVFGLFTTSQASAVLIDGGAFDGVDVGGIDTFIAEITKPEFQSTYGPGGSPAKEELWAEHELGTGVTFSDASKTQTVDWFNTDAENVIAFQLQHSGGYYVVKNAQARVLMQNVIESGWGVINLEDVSINLNLGNDMTISHVTEDLVVIPPGGPGIPVPAPLALLGLGALTLGWKMGRTSAG